MDGEVVVLDDLGRSDFDRLQARGRRRGWYEGAEPVVFAVFDCLATEGKPILSVPLIERKRILTSVLREGPLGIMTVGHFEHFMARELFEGAVHSIGLEGLVAKRPESIYQPGVRSADWVKVKRKGAVPPERFKHGRSD